MAHHVAEGGGRMTPTTPSEVSLVIPVYNEEGAIEVTIREIREVCAKAGLTYELLVVDDGSTDGTRQKLSAAGISPLQSDRRKPRSTWRT